jgi:hypothetical protein
VHVAFPIIHSHQNTWLIGLRKRAPIDGAAMTIFIIRLQRYTGLLLLSLALLCHPFTVEAFETDQYELPPISLADIGDEVSAQVEQKLQL